VSRSFWVNSVDEKVGTADAAATTAAAFSVEEDDADVSDSKNEAREAGNAKFSFGVPLNPTAEDTVGGDGDDAADLPVDCGSAGETVAGSLGLEDSNAALSNINSFLSSSTSSESS
jgi:hypothetical protein